MFILVHNINILGVSVLYYSIEFNTFPEITSIYTVSRNTVWQITDKSNILIFIKDGECNIKYEGTVYNLKTGDVFFIPCGHSYIRTPINNTICTMTYIHFNLKAKTEQVDIDTLTKNITEIKEMMDAKIIGGSSFLPLSGV